MTHEESHGRPGKGQVGVQQSIPTQNFKILLNFEEKIYNRSASVKKFVLR
jgi:hypothetical protein